MHEHWASSRQVLQIASPQFGQVVMQLLQKRSSHAEHSVRHAPQVLSSQRLQYEMHSLQ